jgi:hypothetical protein
MNFHDITALIKRKLALNSLLLKACSSKKGNIATYRSMPHLESIKICGVFLNYPEWIKLGDQFWFEPILRTLKEAGIHIILDCTMEMKEYFSDLGYTISPIEAWSKIDILITRKDLVGFCLRRVDVAIVAVDTADFSMIRPVCQEIVDNAIDLIGLQGIKRYYRPRTLPLEKSKFFEGITGSIWFVNDQVGSGKFRIWEIDRQRLWADVAEKKKEGEVIVFVGSTEDRKKQIRDENIVDLDLRGELSISSLMRSCKDPRVEGVICFDGFLSHLFESCEKKTIIHYRRQFSANKLAAIKRCYHPPFPIGSE